jgi:hypothetical protein
MSTTSGPIRGRLEALQQRLTQTTETHTRTRTPRLVVNNSNVTDLTPPGDIDEYHDLYRSVGIIRGNINQFVRDVVEPGIRIHADDPKTHAYFTGDPNDDADVPEFAPAGGFVENCAVIAGERNQPFYPYLKTSIVQKYTRGTALHEYLKRDDDKTEPKPRIQGFKHIRPETVSARVHEGTNILLAPDETDTTTETTPRGEAAAYIQFDDDSILGHRRDGFDENSVALSQHDVLKQVNDPDIGGNDTTEDGVFGTSPIEAISDDAFDYREIKRNRAEAIKAKVEGVWVAEFNTEVVDAGDEIILTEWDDNEQDDWINDADDLDPGSMMGHDGSITLDQWEPSLPALDDDLQHLVDDILAPLPAPKYATAHGDDITQHVTGEQGDAYQDLIGEERRAQSRDWTQAFRDVASRHPRLDASGVEVRLAPAASSNPVAELSEEEIERMEQFMSALDSGLGDVPVDMVLNVEEFLKMTMDLPDEVFGLGDEIDADESAEELQHMLENFEPKSDSDGDGVTADGV